MPKFILGQNNETTLLTTRAPALSEQFGCPVFIEKAHKSKHPKAKNAWPGKPGVVVE